LHSSGWGYSLWGFCSSCLPGYLDHRAPTRKARPLRARTSAGRLRERTAIDMDGERKRAIASLWATKDNLQHGLCDIESPRV